MVKLLRRAWLGLSRRVSYTDDYLDSRLRRDGLTECECSEEGRGVRGRSSLQLDASKHASAFPRGRAYFWTTFTGLRDCLSQQ